MTCPTIALLTTTECFTLAFTAQKIYAELSILWPMDDGFAAEADALASKMKVVQERARSHGVDIACNMFMEAMQQLDVGWETLAARPCY